MKTITLSIDELTEARLNVCRLELKREQQMQGEHQRDAVRKVGIKIELQEPTMEDAALHALRSGLFVESRRHRPFDDTAIPWRQAGQIEQG